MNKSIEEFWQDFNKLMLNKKSTLFRGVSRQAYELIPSIGRGTKEGTRNDISSIEDNILSEFKRLSTPTIVEPPSTDFEWLFLAQHYGLPTRLLDWSTNPLAALYFAIEGDDENDAYLYHTNTGFTDDFEIFDYKTANYTEEHKEKPVAIFAIQSHQGNVVFVRPKYSDKR
ncbi:FRG domain-containing protein [Dasania sp. GY-MA-18]|uniref:FRG domain-containing protein n=1 Tax=Dasania sp. GY-MA-18 TaxID=2966584 RepID=UPI0021ABF9B4|nr:FRG domain-containing protein [Dasania sp. GY-MA-18]MCR8924360.1 FRG domain-containing protein [Dasania sp. GY-MA-18]